jgi:hypothetical protein
LPVEAQASTLQSHQTQPSQQNEIVAPIVTREAETTEVAIAITEAPTSVVVAEAPVQNTPSAPVVTPATETAAKASVEPLLEPVATTHPVEAAVATPSPSAVSASAASSVSAAMEESAAAILAEQASTAPEAAPSVAAKVPTQGDLLGGHPVPSPSRATEVEPAPTIEEDKGAHSH